MYIPAQFESHDLAEAVDLMKSYSFATLIALDDDGWPHVTHLPLHVECIPAPSGDSTPGAVLAQVAAPRVTLVGHVAKSNPQWRYLRDRGTAVVSFLGPHAYLSPKVYPDSKRVPTWNYVAVECRTHVRLIEDHHADAMMVKMIGDYEPEYLRQWRSLDEPYVSKMLAGIVGFELEIIQIQCKLKLNQHRPESHGAMRRSYAGGNDDERELVRWMDRLKLE